MWSALTIKFGKKPIDINKTHITESIEFKYTFFVVSVFTATLCTFSIPLFFYMNYNYDLFIELAFDSAPSIVQQLEREKFWINRLLVSTITASLVVLSIIVFKLLSQIDQSLNFVKSKIRSLSYGKWDCGPILYKEKTDFSDIISLYNHFYHFNREMQNQELESLTSLNLDTDHPNYQTWVQLVNSKRAQVGLKELSFTSIDVTAFEAPDSRHAS